MGLRAGRRLIYGTLLSLATRQRTLRRFTRKLYEIMLGRYSVIIVASLFAESDIFLNLSATGSLDKAILEAMATCCCVISSNDAFRGIAQEAGFAELAIARTPEATRATLSWVAKMPIEERRELTKRQAAVVLRDHTLDGLMAKLSEILKSAARKAP